MKAIETGLHAESGASNQTTAALFQGTLSRHMLSLQVQEVPLIIINGTVSIMRLPTSYLGSHLQCCSSDELCPSHIPH